MAYIFLDESGDLGFDLEKQGTSRYFMVTFLFSENKAPLENILKRVFHAFSKKEVKRHAGTLHAYKEHPKTRQKVLRALSEKDISILTVYLDKKNVYTKINEEKHVLYNYIANILLSRIFTKKLIPTDKPIHLIASRRETNRFLNENFIDYLKEQTKANHALDLQVEVKKPDEEKSLQLADMVSWSIFRKYEHGDETYYNVIKQKIVEEDPLFP
jgi:undecaprenyl pyrophosphate synthase